MVVVGGWVSLAYPTRPWSTAYWTAAAAIIIKVLGVGH